MMSVEPVFLRSKRRAAECEKLIELNEMLVKVAIDNIKYIKYGRICH